MPAVMLAAALLAAPASAQVARPVPYWASLDEAIARSRTGPSTEFPVKWVYRRKALPVKVVAVHGVWRKIEDQDGDQGWMHVRLLSPERSAVVTAEIADLHAEPTATSYVAWRAARGVVGRIGDCANGWCPIDVAGRRGFVATADIWGEETLLAR